MCVVAILIMWSLFMLGILELRQYSIEIAKTANFDDTNIPFLNNEKHYILWSAIYNYRLSPISVVFLLIFFK